MRKNNTIRFGQLASVLAGVVGAGSVALFAGCGGGSGQQTGQSGQDLSGAGEHGACTTNSDCKVGLECSSAECVYPACTTDYDCASGLVCATDGCRASPDFEKGHACTKDGDCAKSAGLICFSSGKCEAPVAKGGSCKETDCAGELSCSPEGTCVACSGSSCPKCRVDSECASGSFCVLDKCEKEAGDAGAKKDASGVIKDAGTKKDASVKDSGAKDTGTKDSGKKDSGTGTKDSGAKDSGAKDSGSKDSGSKDSGGKDSGGKDSGGKDSGYAFLEPRIDPNQHHVIDLASAQAANVIPFAWHSAPGIAPPADLWVSAKGRNVFQVFSVDDKPFARAGLDVVPLVADANYRIVFENKDGTSTASLVNADDRIMMSVPIAAPAADVVVAAGWWRTAVHSDVL